MKPFTGNITSRALSRTGPAQESSVPTSAKSLIQVLLPQHSTRVLTIIYSVTLHAHYC